MWPDNETDRDFLNFAGVAETVAETIRQAQGKPISIGVSGAWGVGKSSMVKLIGKGLKSDPEQAKRFIFVEFNAWLYQGYDDARAALMDVIADKLEEVSKHNQSAYEKVKDFAGRVRWARVAKLAASALPLAFGLPATGVVGQVAGLVTGLWSKGVTAETAGKTQEAAKEIAGTAGGLLDPKAESSPPKEIQALRDSFKAALDALKMTLVVLIDDLDRCLPETAISTLEAIRLFLFLDNTAFVIAADDGMIKHAVRRHFGTDVNDEVVTSYFDKLITVPIRVPPLGTQDVRAYLALLFVDSSEIDSATRDRIRTRVCEQLARSWEGKRVDLPFIKTLHDTLPTKLVAQLESADRLAPIMVASARIGGNPRLIKRFLNALYIRQQIASRHGITVNEAALAKLLLLERCGSPKVYADLAARVNDDAEGQPRFLSDWEKQAKEGKPPKLEDPWNDPFVLDWLKLPPELSELDLRGELYVSRENFPLISSHDRLTSAGAEVLEALLSQPQMAETIADRVRGVSPLDLEIIMGRLLERAGREKEWGTPDILDACIVVADTNATQASRLAAFFAERPVTQIKADIIPKFADKPWAREPLNRWRTGGVKPNVKKAIESQQKNGNISI